MYNLHCPSRLLLVLSFSAMFIVNDFICVYNLLKHPRLFYSSPQSSFTVLSINPLFEITHSIFLNLNKYSTTIDFQPENTSASPWLPSKTCLEFLRKCPCGLLPVTQLSEWFVTALSDQNNCINKRRKALPVRLCWYHVRSLLNYNYETTNPLIVPPCGLCLGMCHCHMNTGWAVSQKQVFYPSAVLSSIATSLLGEIWSE